mmetsp:Transcript_21637/g.45130  ORF Transcript_21637/g.45130 Transcript_21637/m.45130 type:complete len:264 (-) Transcript_21637:123-914(-)
MKFALFAVTIAAVSAGRPQLSIQVRDGSFDGLDGLDPSLTWSSSTKSGDYDLEVGVDVAARPTADLASLPRSAWGVASRSFGAWGVSARADVERDNMDNAAIEVNADNSGDDLSFKLFANAGSSGSSVNRIEATKSFNSGDARVTVNPRMDVASKDVDVTIGYDAGRTNVEVEASQQEQTLKVSQQIDDDNRVAPSFALRSGKVAVEWERNLGDDNSLTTTFRPDEEIEMEWKDADWTANIQMPLSGNAISGANVSVKREVNF